MCNYRKIGEEYIHYDRENQCYDVKASKPGEFVGIDFFNIVAQITTPVNSYKPNEFGLYNVCGNVAEMIMEEGIAVGGSWRCPGWDVRVVSSFSYKKAYIDIGFRPVVSFVKR